MAQIELDIDKYLSEEEKKQLAIDVFKERISKELFKSREGTIQSDSEIQRVIGNISHAIVMKEVQKYIPDFESQIKNKVKKALSEGNIKYEIFKVKNAWDSQESLAITHLNEAVKENRDILKQRVLNAIMNYDLSSQIKEEVSSLFEEMAGNLYKLSELFTKE